jgi:hypothetical protein
VYRVGLGLYLITCGLISSCRTYLQQWSLAITKSRPRLVRWEAKNGPTEDHGNCMFSSVLPFSGFLTGGALNVFFVHARSVELECRPNLLKSMNYQSINSGPCRFMNYHSHATPMLIKLAS